MGFQQVEQARTGIDALQDSQMRIHDLRENFELIDRYRAAVSLQSHDHGFCDSIHF